MSRTITLVGTTSILSAEYYPPIELSPKYEYCLGLIGFHTYNSIPNIEEKINDSFHFKIHGQGKERTIILPEGSYEINDIENYIHEQLAHVSPRLEHRNVEELLQLRANNSTLKIEIFSKYLDIDLTKARSIGPLLGFSNNRILNAGNVHISDLPVDIIKVTSVRLECNIVLGSYYDNNLSHTLFEFAPDVEPGFAINKEPQNIIYMPIANSRSIDNISVRIVDQDGNLVNFREEKRIVRLELKPNGYSF